MPTFRTTVLLLLVAPLIALSARTPFFLWMAALLLLAIVVLAISDRRRAGPLASFEITRQHDDRLSLAADNPVTLTLRNRQLRAVTFELRDEPPNAWLTDGPIVLRGVVGARERWQDQYSVHPLQRGDYTFGDMTLRWRGPLGLWVRQQTLPARAAVKVYPNLRDVRKYDLLLRRNRLQEIGLRNSRQYGQGSEYERLRDYTPDDDFRRINWKATARRHRPITVEYQIERSQHVMIVIESGRMMRSPVDNVAKLDYVVNAALLLSYVATGMGDKVGLMTFADTVDTFISPRQGREQFYRTLEVLYRVEAQPVEPDYQRAFAYLGSRVRRRSLLVIFTDFSAGLTLTALQLALAALAKRSLPLIVTISDPDVVAASHETVSDSVSVYRRVAAARLLDERRLLLNRLKLQGVNTLDLAANQLSLAVIQRYLDIKRKTLL